MPPSPPTSFSVFADVGRHPVSYFVRYWNWKSSLLSALFRAAMFFTVNLPAGLGLASTAMVTELIFRAIASGVLGSLTQALRFSRPRLAALVLLPALGHAAEFFVHLWAGTPRLQSSVAASIVFSVLTSAFNLFAMRRGALIVGPGQRSLRFDVARLPSLALAFVISGLNAVGLTRARHPPDQ